MRTSTEASGAFPRWRAWICPRIVWVPPVNRAAPRGRDKPPPLGAENRETEFALERRDRFREPAVGNAEERGRPAQASDFEDRAELLQAFGFHGNSLIHPVPLRNKIGTYILYSQRVFAVKKRSETK